MSCDTRLASIEPEGMAEADKLAHILADSGLVPKQMQGRPADVLLALLTGRALGLPAVLALSRIHIVEGRPVLAADAMLGLAMAHPACEYVALVESTNTTATYEARRRGAHVATRMSFTIEDAKVAGLAGRGNWAKYPAAMLRARAASAIARAVFPDVLAGVYDPDEMVRDDSPGREPVREVRREPEPAVVEAEIVEDHGAQFSRDDLAAAIKVLDWSDAPPWARPPAISDVESWIEGPINDAADAVAAAAQVRDHHSKLVAWLTTHDRESAWGFDRAVLNLDIDPSEVRSWARHLKAGGAGAIENIAPARRQKLLAALSDPTHATRALFDGWLSASRAVAS